MLLCCCTTQNLKKIKPFNSEKFNIAQATKFNNHSISTKQFTATQQINLGKLVSQLFGKAIQLKSHHSVFIENQEMKKKINTRKMQEKKWTQMFATDFSFNSFTMDLVTKIEIRKGQQCRSFIFSIILIWMVQIYCSNL